MAGAKVVLRLQLRQSVFEERKHLEDLINNLLNVNPIIIYLIAALIAYIENIFPPFPSDVILIGAGYLCAAGKVDFIIVLILSTMGSSLGFMTMYKIGKSFGINIVEKNKFRFLKLDKLKIVETWFNKYGYYVVIGNRFLAGTRAVISFFAGMSQLPFLKTTFFASLSSLIWNFILVFSGKKVGENWESIVVYLERYGQIITALTIMIVLAVIIKAYFRKKRNVN